MKSFPRPLAVYALAFPVLGAAGLHVEQAAIGGRQVVISFDDSTSAPDLDSIRVKGYGLENAAFVEEDDAMTLSSDLWDLTAPNAPRLLQRDPSDSNAFVLVAPPRWVPRPGIVLADTSQGGILVKVTDVKPVADFPTRFWVMTQPAFLSDAIVEGEFRFKIKLDLNTAFADQRIHIKIPGEDNNGMGDLQADWRGAKTYFQPEISGVLRVHNALLDRAEIHVQGPVELSGKFSAGLQGGGRFSHAEMLPNRRTMLLPLGHGICLSLQEDFNLRIDADAAEEDISGQAALSMRQSLQTDLVYDFNRWRPNADMTDLPGESPDISLHGKGTLRFTLEPRLEFSMNGQPVAAVTVSPSIRISDLPLDSTSGPAGGLTAWRKSAVSLRASPLSPYCDPRRNFLLLSREKMWVGPPLQGWADIVATDSNTLILQCRTEPAADFFAVQRLTPSFTWETVLFNVPGPRITITGLHAGVENRVRLIGVNSYGPGPAFPPEGVVYIPPSSSPQPYLSLLSSLPTPAPLRPDTVVKGDSGTWLAWTLPDSQARGNALFNVYLGTQIGLMQPIAQSLRDTQLWVPHLDSGKTYFWKVEFVQGTRFNDGPPQYFTYLSNAPRPRQAPAVPPAVAGMVFVAAGSFKRSDGTLVSLNPFYLQKTEVTQKDYRKVTGSNPSFHEQDSLPVERVTWEEASHYCREIGGRLPTEAEWEFAARAGEPGPYYWGDQPATEYARFKDNSENHTWPVGSLKPNALGLFDMAGNVFEWTQDWYADYNPADRVNPKGPPTGESKVIRGASWYSEGQSLDLSARFSNRPGFRNFKVGFRCAKDAPAAASLAGSHP